MPGIRPTTKHLLKLEKNINSTDAKIIVLTANFYSNTIGKKFAKKIDASFVSASTNVGDENISNYFELFDSIINELLK